MNDVRILWRLQCQTCSSMPYFWKNSYQEKDTKYFRMGKIRIVNPKQDIEVYSRLAAEHGIFIRELTRKQASLEAYYMNLKKGGNQGC